MTMLFFACYTDSMKPDNDMWQQPSTQSSGAPFAHVDEKMNDESISDGIESSPMSSPSIDEAEITSGDYEDIVRWDAPEYIARQKSPLWFGGLIVIVVVLMIVAIFFMKQWTFAVLVPVMATALIIYSRRSPHVAQYTLSRQGLHIDGVLSPYVKYKSFSLVHGDDQYSFLLVPRKRFEPGTWVYFPEDKGEVIVDTLAARLPMQEQRLDPIDRLIRKLRI